MSRLVNLDPSIRHGLSLAVANVQAAGAFAAEWKLNEPQVPYDGVMFYPQTVPEAEIDRVVDFYWNSDERSWMVQGMSLVTGDIDFILGGLSLEGLEFTLVPMVTNYLVRSAKS